MYYNFTAPRFMVRNIFGYEGPGTATEKIDSRLYVVFQPNTFGDYVGCDFWSNAQFAHVDEDLKALGYSDNRIQTAKDWNYDDHLEPYFSM